MDEFSAALQFPHYFGENWSALEESLSEMDWLRAGTGIVVMIRDALDTLAEEAADELATLVGTLAHAAQEYSKPVDLGEWWDRPALPFHVVLHTIGSDQAELARRWGAAGARLVPFPA
jgi:hypothetical protein